MKKIATLFSILTCAFSMAHADDETNFSAAPPASWQRVNPLGLATFTFTNGVATIAAAPPSPQQAQTIGLARGTLLAPAEWTDCAVSADVVAWSATRVFTSVITRVGTPAGLGMSRGYSFTLIPSTGAVELHRLDGEIPTKLAPTQFISMTAGATFRLVLASVGERHTARIYAAADLAQPLFQASVLDATYASGRCGIVASTDSYTTIQASYDNFLAWSGAAAPLTVVPGSLAWKRMRAARSRRFGKARTIFPAETGSPNFPRSRNSPAAWSGRISASQTPRVFSACGCSGRSKKDARSALRSRNSTGSLV